jgi:hypothetical protein
VHIPKSAGSDLASHLTSRYPTLNTRLSHSDLASHEAFLLSLKHFALEAEHADTIFVTGHNHLATYKSWQVLRHDDRIFSVLRNPLAQVISQLNYVINRIFSDEVPAQPDTLGWRAEFGIAAGDSLPSHASLIDLAHRILRHPGVVPGNVACFFLGEGTYRSAVEQVATCNVELVELSTYDAWCRSEWGVTRSHHVNASTKFLTEADLSASDLDYAEAMIREDRQLHDALLVALRDAGSSSVRGTALALSSRTVRSPPISAAANDPDETALDAFMLAFESLGENCEFGLVQRRCGAEPLGLLRFASAPYAVLMAALKARFVGLGRADLLEVQLSDNGREYMVKDLMFGFLWHAWVQVGEMTSEEVLEREQRRLPFLVGKMLEDLASGEKVMVYHGMQPLWQSQAEALAALIGEIGPRTTLLWVELAEPGHAAGSVVRLGPHLVKGFMDRFAPGENAHDLSLDCWISVCEACVG